MTVRQPPDARLCPGAVVRWLTPLLSEHRRGRIERVVRRRLCSVTVVLEQLYDPHNGAAALRTAEALGLLHVHVVEGATPFRVSRKVSQSAHKWLDVRRHASVADCVAQLRAAGFVSWAAIPPDLGRARELPRGAAVEVDATRPVALLVGNEHGGLSEEALAAADRRCSVPMDGFTESFNLSVAVALSLQQVVARRRRHLGRRGDLPPWAIDRLRAAYYGQSTPHAADVILRHLRAGARATR